MNILIVSNGRPTKKSISGIFEYDQAEALKESGHNVFIAEINLRSFRHKRNFGYINDFHRGIETYTYSFPIGRIPRLFRVYIMSYLLKKIIKKVLKKNIKIDIIHAHFTEFGYAAILTKRKFRIPIVFSEHFSMINKDKVGKQLRYIARRAYLAVDALIASSKSLSTRMINLSGRIPNLIELIVDSSLFKPSYNNKRVENSIISVGRLDKNKNTSMLIQAFDIYMRSSKYNLIIFGDGVERKRLEEMIISKKLSNRVKLMGMQSRPSIAQAMKISDGFYVSGTKSENFGVAFIEALASGLPVVTTKCGGPEGFLDSSNSILVDVDDMEGLGNAMITMAKNIEKYNREEISRINCLRFSKENIVQKLEKVYNNVLEKVIK